MEAVYCFGVPIVVLDCGATNVVIVNEVADDVVSRLKHPYDEFCCRYSTVH